MSTRARIGLNVLAWMLSIPVVSICLTALDRHQTRPLSGAIVAGAAVALLLWAGLIYWRCVPSAASLMERAIYFAAFIAVMLLAGAGALWATFWLTVAVYGL